MTDIGKIAKLKELLDSGALTQEEFDIEKNKILNKTNLETSKISKPTYILITVFLAAGISYFVNLQNENVKSETALEFFETTTTENTFIITTTSAPKEVESLVVGSLDDAKKAVVKINTVSDIVEISERLSVESLNIKGTGSGFLVSENGYIVTNYHVIAGADNISVYSPYYKKTVKANLIGYSECDDLAVLKISNSAFNESNYYFNWSSNNINLSDKILNLSFPLGDNETTYLEGNISKEKSDGNQAWTAVEKAFEHTAEILPGSSGSPILNSDFNIVGVAYAGNSFKQEFAIEGSYAKEIIEGLIKKENRVNFGFVLEQYEGIGAYISSLKEDSIGFKAGLRAGDIITKIGPYDLSQESTLYTYCKVLRTVSSTDKVDIEWYRISDTYDYKSTLNGPLVINAIPLNAVQYSKSEIDNYYSLIKDGRIKVPQGDVIITYSGSYNDLQINTVKNAIQKINQNISIAQIKILKKEDNNNSFGRIHWEFTTSLEKIVQAQELFSRQWGVIGCSWEEFVWEITSTKTWCSNTANRNKFKYGSTNVILFAQRPGNDWFGDWGKSRYTRGEEQDVMSECMQNDILRTFLATVFFGENETYFYEDSKSILFRKYCNGEGSNYLSNYDIKMVQIHYDPRNIKSNPTLQDLYNQFDISA